MRRYSAATGILCTECGEEIIASVNKKIPTICQFCLRKIQQRVQRRKRPDDASQALPKTNE